MPHKQRIEFSKDAPPIPASAAAHDHHAEVASAAAPVPTQPASRAGTAADHRGSTSNGRPGTADTTASHGGLTEAELALIKEEEEFLKMESIFITELGMSKDQLPSFARPAEQTAT